MTQSGHFVAHLTKDGLAPIDAGETAFVTRALDLQSVEFDDGAVLPVAHHRRLHHFLEGDFLDGRDQASAQLVQSDDMWLARRASGEDGVE